MAILQSVSGEPCTRRLLLVPAAPRMPNQIEEWLAEDNSVVRGAPTRDELLRDSESSSWDAAVCWIGDATHVPLSMLPLLRQFRDLPVVGVGGVDTARVAVEALWRGAAVYVAFRDDGKESLIAAVERACRVPNWIAKRSNPALVAHDLNNVLTIIGGECDWARDQLSRHHPVQEALRVVAASCRRGGALVARLLSSKGGPSAKPAAADLNSLIARMEPIFGRLVGKNIDLLVRQDPTLPPIDVDLEDLEQILMNLVMNARDAIGSFGTMTIETARARLRMPESTTESETPRVDVSRLIVSDTGCGMSEETKAKAFDPYFTTKSADTGTGLGLARVREIVSAAGGRIEVDSEPGMGTSVIIDFPDKTFDPTADVQERRSDVSRPD